MSLGMVIALAMALGYPCVAPKGTATPEKDRKAMELRNASVKLPADLHQQIKDELEAKNITMSQFFEMAAKEHFDKEKGGKTMANGRTLAFTVSEELFQKVKEYLAWYERTYHRRLTQKEFVLGLIEDELEKMSEAMETERQAETAAGCGDGDAADEAGGEAALCAPESGAQAEETAGADTDTTEYETEAYSEESPYDAEGFCGEGDPQGYEA